MSGLCGTVAGASAREAVLPRAQASAVSDRVRAMTAFLPVLLALAAPASAAWQPSPDLSFRVVASRDSILVGDPISLTFEASGPEGAALLLPAAEDSLGPLAVLSVGQARTSVREGRLRLQRKDQVTAYRTGRLVLPELPLLWIREGGDTLAAWSRPLAIRVGSLVEDEATLENLRDLRGVVPLSSPRWWLWAVILAGAAGLVWLALRLRSRFGPRILPKILKPEPPPLPPEVAFERGYQNLLGRELPERGRFKEFYGEISLLLRAYLEGRFRIPAVEETRSEVMAQVRGLGGLEEARRTELEQWLEEGDLVKFAKLDRLLDQARDYGERAREWVLRTTPVAVPAATGTEPGTATGTAAGSEPGAEPGAAAGTPAGADLNRDTDAVRPEGIEEEKR